MALNKRGLGAKQVHAKSKVSMHVGKGLEHGGKHAPIACKMYATERQPTRTYGSAQRAANAEWIAAAATVVCTLQLLTKKGKM